MSKQTRKKWSVVNDGLQPIIESIEGLDRIHPQDLADCVKVTMGRPSGELAYVWNHGYGNYQGPGFGSRREMARRWLQSTGFPEAADEFHRRLQSLLDRLREWEKYASSVLHRRDYDRRYAEWAGEPVDAIDRLGEEVAESWNDVLDEAGEVLDYLRQLKVMVSPPALSDTARLIFQWLYEHGIDCPDDRVTLEIVVAELWPSNDHNSYKKYVSELKGASLVTSKPGSRGGMWLTPAGTRHGRTLFVPQPE